MAQRRVNVRPGQRKPVPSLPPAEPAPPARERFRPPWLEKDRRNWVHHTSLRMAAWVESVEAGEFRIPPFQRAWCWTDPQILRLLDSLFRGYHVGSLLIWERQDLPPSTERFGEVVVHCLAGRGGLIVDGQQRLGAMATAVRSGRFFFDLEAGTFDTAGAGGMRCPLDCIFGMDGWSRGMDWVGAHAAEHGLDEERVFNSWNAAVAMNEHADVSAVQMPSNWPLVKVVESFRRLNTEGTRMPPEELAAALARFEQERAT